jgi:hypothetical protein
LTKESTCSDAGGTWRFQNVGAGVYNIVIADDRYAPDTVRLTIDKDTTVSFALLESARVLDSIPDTLYRERSPYLLRKEVSTQRPLVILPGVTIRFMKSGQLNIGAGISAVGNRNDSIVFAADSTNDDSLHSSIWLTNTQGGIFDFRFCRFERLNTLFAHYYGNLYVNNCLFTRMKTALSLDDGPPSGFEAVFSHNTVVNCKNGIAEFFLSPESHDYRVNLLQLTVTDNLIRCSDIALSVSIPERTGRKVHILHNTCTGLSRFNMDYLEESDTIIDNVFSEIRFDNVSGKAPFFAYNVFENGQGELPPGIGVPTLQNNNGDSCDFYYNVRMDPRIADSVTGALFQGSPCIGAASDQTNIGVYQGVVMAIGREHYHQLHKQSGRMISLLIGKQQVCLPEKVHEAISRGKCTFSLFTVLGQRVFTTTGVLPGMGNVITLKPDISPGHYLLRIDGVGGPHHAAFLCFFCDMGHRKNKY